MSIGFVTSQWHNFSELHLYFLHCSLCSDRQYRLNHLRLVAPLILRLVLFSLKGFYYRALQKSGNKTQRSRVTDLHYMNQNSVLLEVTVW